MVMSKGLKASGRSEEGQPAGHSSASRGWSTLGKESPSPTHVHHLKIRQELLTPARSPVFWGQLGSTFFKDHQRKKIAASDHLTAADLVALKPDSLTPKVQGWQRCTYIHIT